MTSFEKHFILREYVPSDIEGILIVFKDSIKGLCTEDYPPSQIEAWLACADKEKWKSQFSARHSAVVESDGKIVGFCDIENSGHIDRLYVSPLYADKGIGTALIKDAEKAFDVKTVTVEASITAKPFFEKLGYETVEKQSVEKYGQSLTNYRMRKTLR